MINDLFVKIISKKKTDDNLMTQLRNSLTGNEINIGYLLGLGYKEVNKDNSVWSM